MKDDLVEQVSATIKRLTRAYAPATPEELARAILAIARPAILEQAAQVAEGEAQKFVADDEGLDSIDAAMIIASRVRALATTGQEGGR